MGDKPLKGGCTEGGCRSDCRGHEAEELETEVRKHPKSMRVSIGGVEGGIFDPGPEATEGSVTLCSRPADIGVRSHVMLWAVIHHPLLSLFYGPDTVWIIKMQMTIALSIY